MFPRKLVSKWSILVSRTETETEEVGVYTGGDEIPGGQGILQEPHNPLFPIASTGETPTD